MGLDFDEWMLTKDKSYVPTDDSMSLRLLRECWFRRDAEIEELAAALESLIDMDVAYQRGRKVVEAVENACAVLAKVRKP